MLEFNFNYLGGDGLSWMEWERLLARRASRAKAAHGLCVTLRTAATMTPYDPSAGGAKPIMVYLKRGLAGTRAKMVVRWPGGLGGRMASDKPYAPHARRIAHWVIKGDTPMVPDEVTTDIGEALKTWVKKTFFSGTLSPEEQWKEYRSGKGGAYGPGGTRKPEIINPWELLGGGDEVKKRASLPAKYDSRFADVYSKRGPGFLSSMSIEVGIDTS